MIESSIKLVFKRWFLLMGVYTLMRILFFAYNYNLYSELSVSTWSYSFLHGLRFDVYAILWTNIPFWILAFIPLERYWGEWARRVEAILFGIWNLFFIGLSVTDVELYRFQGKRISLEVFSMSSDIADQSWSMIFYYWPLSLTMLILAGLLIYFYPKRWLSTKPVSWKRALPLALCMVIGMVLGMRGGWQLKPIRPIHAYTQSSSDLGALTLNSAFTLIRSREAAEIDRMSFYSEPKQVGEWVTKDLVSRPPLASHKKANAVIFILESFSLEYMGWPDGSKQQMPFLNRLAEESVFFPFHFANGRRSIDAVPSIVCGLPSMMLEPFPTSNYQGNQLRCLGHVLKAEGYKTLFFHGAQNGSMYIDSFAKRAGFEKFYGNNEYPDPSKTDGHWGVYDGPFLDFAVEELDNVEEPFVAVIFTLSSHHPYRIPDVWKGKLPKGSMEIHESIAYTDAMVENFFKQAKEKSWYKDTVFFLTGDHTSKSEDPRFQNPRGVFRVPLVVSSGGKPLPPTNESRIVQQADISPSILDILGVKAPQFLRFGRSIFNLESAGRAINYNSRGYWLLKNSTYVHTDHLGRITDKGFWGETNFMDPAQTPPAGQVEENTAELRGLIQYFKNGLLDNSWEELSHWGF